MDVLPNIQLHIFKFFTKCGKILHWIIYKVQKKLNTSHKKYK